jgi:hypothetical protein
MSASLEGSLVEAAALADRPDRRSHSRHRGWDVVLLILQLADVLGLATTFIVAQRLFGLPPLLLSRAPRLLKRVRVHLDCLYANRWSPVDACKRIWTTVP